VGTADAVYQNLDLLRRGDPEFILILAGDHIYKMDYAKLIAAHARSGADMTVECLQTSIDEARAFGVVGVDANGRSTRFAEKPAVPDAIPGRPDTGLVSMGINVFNAPFLYEQLNRDAANRASSHDFGKDLIPYLVPRFRIFAHRFEDSCIRSSAGAPYWRDVGTLDAYWADQYGADPGHARSRHVRSTPAHLDPSGAAGARYVRLSAHRAAAADSQVSNGYVSGGTIRRSVLFSNSRIAERSVVEDSVLLPEVEVGRHAELRKVIVDKRCRIPDGPGAGFDQRQDRQRFQVSDGGVTLITPAMLGQV
jgi:glucose-1-phosphate adenylyltransferase